MKYLLPLFFISCFFSTLFSQQYNDVVKQDIFGHPGDAQNQMYINMLNRSEAMKGHGQSSLYDDWQSSTIASNDGTQYAIDSINYNYSTDQFYFLHNDNPYYLQSDKVKSLNINGDVFSSYKYEVDGKTKKGYLQVLVDGDAPLLKRTYLKETVVNDHPMKVAQANKIKYEKTSELYYLNKKSGMAEKLPRNKKKFINLFKKRQSKLIHFAEEQKISTHNENDMIRFFQYNKMINSEINQ